MDGAFPEPHADAHDGAEEGNLLDRALQLIAARAIAPDRHGFGAQRHRANFAGLGVADTAGGHDFLIVQGDPAALGIEHAALQDVEGADEGGDEARAREIINLEGRADLLHAPLAHHHDAIGHGESFFLVVSHIDGGDAELALHRADLLAQRDADLGVQG